MRRSSESTTPIDIVGDSAKGTGPIAEENAGEASEHDDTALAEPEFDRRRNRLALWPCRQCGRRDGDVVVRTSIALYVRCPTCAVVWAQDKPDHI